MSRRENASLENYLFSMSKLENEAATPSFSRALLENEAGGKKYFFLNPEVVLYTRTRQSTRANTTGGAEDDDTNNKDDREATVH